MKPRQLQLPRSGPDGQPIESSQLARLLEIGDISIEMIERIAELIADMPGNRK
jgi:hypothetical protein